MKICSVIQKLFLWTFMQIWWHKPVFPCKIRKTDGKWLVIDNFFHIMPSA